MTSPFYALPCGTDPESLLAYAPDSTAPSRGSHEATCPWCRTAISEFTELWHPVHRWASREVAVPEHFRAAVMHRVRRIVQSPRHAALITAQGVTTVTSWVLGLIATAAALDTPGVNAIIGSPTPRGHSRTRRSSELRYGADGVDIAELGETDIGVTLAITAQPTANLPQLADLVRQNIITAIRTQTGIETAEVDIMIDDVGQ